MLTIEEITQKLTPVFEQNGVTKEILFGSYATGTATEDSDIDIVVETEPHIRGLKFFGILGSVIDELDKEVDLIPRQDIIPNGRIDIEILKTGRVIYEKHLQHHHVN
jgi:predicted nucleotidyltransferase